jgi:probable DNA metabolism protein
MHIERTTDVWEYDGSYYGFLTVVYHAFKKNSFPEMILTPETSVETLFLSEWIDTNEKIAKKMYERLVQRIRKENVQFIVEGFYCSLKNKERCLLEAIYLALTSKDLLTNHLGHPAILALQKSIQALFSEVHLFTGFVRFEYIGTLLYSQITPKHFSLPFLCPHFAQRYPNETLMIYDETHRLLAMIEQSHIRFIENTDPPAFQTHDSEQDIQQNWRTFLQAVTIDERKNERVQLSHLPKRFRGNMIDFQ